MVTCHLRRHLREAGMSQREFAERSGLNTKMVSRLSRNQMSMISFLNIERVCKTLTKPIEEVFTID
jgi:transcriptional regulator with XRE-family HTH domain|tara:strand:+ start:741 stop:938 length:198 start_codon:yes stop_codon:yes gene_type:complete